TLPPDVRERYTDEWLAELDAEPGGDLSKLFFAARVCLRARATGSAIRGGVPRPGMAGKRTFDLAAAASAPFLLAPLLVFVALAVRIEDGGPVFSRMVMVGKDGRPFRMYRFRTVPAQAASRPWPITGHGCPRPTRTGAWLRRSYLDELPQLINVL